MHTSMRQAAAADVVALVALTRKTINASYRPFLGDQRVAAFLDSGVAEQYVADHLAQCRVILADGDVVGCAVCKDNSIDLLMIDQGYHRRGLGTKLLKDCEDRLFGHFPELTLESFEKNQPANSFYVKNGWVEVKRYRDESSGGNKIVFRKVNERAVGPGGAVT